MCDTTSNPTKQESSGSERPVRRRSILGAALAGAGVAAATTVGATSIARAESPRDIGTPRRPLLPVRSDQPKGTVLTQLGTAGGPQAEYVRTGTSTVLTVEGHNYVVDAGRASVTQYLNAGLQFKKLAGMFITHLHADHLADYYNYFLLEGGQPNAEKDMLRHTKTAGLPLPVYGPGPAGALPPQPSPPQPHVPTISPSNPTPGIKTLTDRMTEAFAYSYNVFLRGDAYHPITEYTSDINEIAVPAGVKASPTNTAPAMQPFKIFEDNRVRVSAILVPHGHVFPCFAYRFDTSDGRSVVFSGDTSKSDNVIALAHDADVLVHCAMQWDFIYLAALAQHKDPDKDPELVHLHTSLATTLEAAEVAQSAGVRQLVLTHLIPSNPRDVPDVVWKATSRIKYRGNIHVGNDLDQISLPAPRRPRVPGSVRTGR